MSKAEKACEDSEKSIYKIIKNLDPYTSMKIREFVNNIEGIIQRETEIGCFETVIKLKFILPEIRNVVIFTLRENCYTVTPLNRRKDEILVSWFSK